MNNFSEVTSFVLTDYYGMKDLKPLYFCIFLILYITIFVENVALIWVVYHEKHLHEPMYLLLCNLAVNGLYGGSALLPALLSIMLSHTYEISLSLCQTQIFAIHTFGAIEFAILAVMSYDRYVAICHPLPYHAIMSQKLVKLIIYMWLFPLLAFLIVFIFTLQLRFCNRSIEKVYCANFLLVKLACTDTSVGSILLLLSLGVYALPQLIMIFYSYAHILRICALSFGKSGFKALKTCTPHLIAITNFSIGCFFEVVQSRFDLRNMPYGVKLFLSLYFLIFPPILNPVIYGLGIRGIRVQLFKHFSRKSKQVRMM